MVTIDSGMYFRAGDREALFIYANKKYGIVPFLSLVAIKNQHESGPF